MKRSIKKLLLAICSLAFVSYANAADIYCLGKINNAFINQNGELIVNSTWRGDYTQVCNVKNIWKGVDPTMCRNWYTMILTSITKGVNVQLYYSDPSTSSCSTVATYQSAPSPWFVMLLNN